MDKLIFIIVLFLIFLFIFGFISFINDFARVLKKYNKENYKNRFTINNKFDLYYKMVNDELYNNIDKVIVNSYIKNKDNFNKDLYHQDFYVYLIEKKFKKKSKKFKDMKYKYIIKIEMEKIENFDNLYTLYFALYKHFRNSDYKLITFSDIFNLNKNNYKNIILDLQDRVNYDLFEEVNKFNDYIKYFANLKKSFVVVIAENNEVSYECNF